MIERELAKKILVAAEKYPIIIITGPRQSGKTTLAKFLFREYRYVSLEDIDIKNFALTDSRGFLAQFKKEKIILDEVQKVPELLSYLQTMADSEKENGRFILTGSQNFLLMEKVSQSLAGRAAIFNLLPFSSSELFQKGSLDLDFSQVPDKVPDISTDLKDIIFAGFYPRIHDQKLEPQEWLRNYYLTYLERDVRTITNVGDLDTFNRFVSLCAGRSGCLLDLVSLGNDCGISNMTVKRWLSILQASFIIMLLPPYFKNFNKRIIKSSKLYFLDTGLLCYLLRLKQASEYVNHPLKGAIFETFIVSEFIKKFHNKGLRPELYYFRDSGGHEIDLLIDNGSEILPIEVKAGETFNSDFLKNLDYFRSLADVNRSILLYGGDNSFTFKGHLVLSWKTV